MKGDFTRWTFRPEEHYHGVLKQQGRVDLDADWNEQNAIASHRIEVETLDVIGPAGAPRADPGFTLKPGPHGDLIIGKGRAYVDGILCENDADVSVSKQPDQAHYVVPKETGAYVAYLEVWLRHITALDDPEIREVALGGPDTCTRAKTVWQVRLLASEDENEKLDCSSGGHRWNELIAPSTGTLAARAQPDPAATDPCTIPVQAGYRRLENQLYRVEIHEGGTGAAASFKWSRDNGSVATTAVAWPAGSTDQINVSSTGPDSVLGFAAGQWIEITDDEHELNFRPGVIVQLANVESNTLTVNLATATGPIGHSGFPLNPKVRRWDSNPTQPALKPMTPGSWVNLESGVQVNFTDGTYKTGDYWMIPARTLTANIDWRVVNGVPAAEPPKGIHRHYCRLATLKWDGTAWIVLASCLPIFPPLTAIGSGATIHAVHVTAVNLVTANGEVVALVNDSSVPLASLEDAFIQVVCDTPLNPLCAKLPSCFVTVDLPRVVAVGAGAGGGVAGFQPLILNNLVSVSSNSMQCAFSNVAIELLSELQKEQSDPLLAHLTLKGAKIWSQDDPAMYLDGEAFGTANQSNVGLRYPSGGGLRGSDFEMWFWLGAVNVPVFT